MNEYTMVVFGWIIDALLRNKQPDVRHPRRKTVSPIYCPCQHHEGL